MGTPPQTFGDMQQALLDWLNRPDLTSVAPQIIQTAQKNLERSYNFKGCDNVFTTTQTLLNTPDDAFIILPKGYKETIWFKVVDGIGNMYYMIKDSPLRAINSYANLQQDRSRPRRFSTIESKHAFLIRPTPDMSYSYILYSYVWLPPLVNLQDTNWFTQYAWDVLLYGSLWMAKTVYLKTEADAELALFQKAIADIEKQEQQEELNGSYQGIRSRGGNDNDYIDPWSGRIV